MGKKRISVSGDQEASLLWLVISIILLGIFLFIKAQFLSHLDSLFLLSLGICGGVFGSLGLLGSLVYFVFSTFEKRAAEKAYQKSLIDIQALPNEFTTVTLKDIKLPFFLSREEFHCTAKLDEDGKVICKIELGYTFSTEDYESFLANFTIED